ncbi:NAD-dependent malic enzyme, partial [Clostridium perfringens]
MENNGLGGKSIILRLEMNTQEIKFGQVASAIFEAGGDMVAIDVIQASGHITVRDITI